MSDWAGADTDVCRFRKHSGQAWEDVARDDPTYLEWLMDDDEHDFTIEAPLYDHLMDLLEEI